MLAFEIYFVFCSVLYTFLRRSNGVERCYATADCARPSVCPSLNVTGNRTNGRPGPRSAASLANISQTFKKLVRLTHFHLIDCVLDLHVRDRILDKSWIILAVDAQRLNSDSFSLARICISVSDVGALYLSKFVIIEYLAFIFTEFRKLQLFHNG